MRAAGRAFALLVVGLGLAASTRGEALTIATYNIENYGLANRMTEDGYRQDYPKPEKQKQALRRVIVQLKADVLVIEEIGGQAYLDELRRDLRREGLDYPHAILLEGPDVARQVALLSNRPPMAVVQHTKVELTYFGAIEQVKRGVLEAHFRTDGGELTLFAVHLKSRYTDRPDDPRSSIRRTAEAVAVRDLVLSRYPRPADSAFVILGDFNDDKTSAPLRRIVHRGRTAVAQLVPAADSRGETWTHSFRKEDSYSRVDYILVSPGLRSAVRGGSARIYDGDGVGDASDHRPVMVTIDR